MVLPTFRVSGWEVFQMCGQMSAQQSTKDAGQIYQMPTLPLEFTVHHLWRLIVTLDNQSP